MRRRYYGVEDAEHGIRVAASRRAAERDAEANGGIVVSRKGLGVWRPVTVRRVFRWVLMAAVVASVAGCAASSSSSASSANRKACNAVRNVQMLNDAGGGGPVFQPLAINETLRTVAEGTTPALHRHLIAAAAANLGVVVAPGSLRDVERDCSALGIK